MQRYLYPLFVCIRLIFAGLICSRGATAAPHITAALSIEAYDLAVHPTTNRLYVSTQTEVRVLDGSTHQTLHTIPTNGDTRIEIDVEDNRIFLIGSGYGLNNNRLTLLDGSDHSILQSVLLDDPENKPDSAYNPVTHRFYMTDQGCSRPECKSFIAVYDGATLQHEEWITTERNPGEIVMDTGLNQAYVIYPGLNVLSVIDGSTETLVTNIPLPAPLKQIALDPKTHILYGLETGTDGITVIDGTQRKVLGRHPFPSEKRWNTMAFNAATGEIVLYWLSDQSSFHLESWTWDQKLFWWKGDTTPDGTISFDRSLTLGNQVWGWLRYPPYGLWFNPNTGRLYANYGDSGWNGTQERKLLIIEEGPPVDVTPPTMTVTSENQPNAAGWFRENVPLKFIAHDNPGGLGVESITLRQSCCGSRPIPWIAGHTQEEQIDYILSDSSFRNRSTELEYIVRDYAGNEYTGRYAANIDVALPVTRFRLTRTPEENVQVTLIPADTDGSGVADTWYSLDNDAVVNYTGPFVVALDRAHEVKYYSRDIAGNEEAVQSLLLHRSGDVNGDEQVNVGDVTQLLQSVTASKATTPQQLVAGDLDGNGHLSILDAVRLLRRIAG